MWKLICIVPGCPLIGESQEIVGECAACMGCGAIYDRPAS